MTVLSFIFSLENLNKYNLGFQYQKKTTMDEIFKSKIIIILKDDLDPKSSTINIQDYIENGKSFIPIFSTLNKFKESTKGMIKNKIIYIDGILFLSALHGNETLRLDPSLKGETYFKAADLIKKYSADIEGLQKKLKH